MDNVIVTGASRGLGLAIAERLASDGFSVVAVARRNSEAFSAAAKRFAASGPGALTFCPLDLADTAAFPGFARDLRRQFGPIYGLVNNAGLGTAGLLATMPDPEIEALIRLNTLSPILLSKYVVRGMMAQGRGRVVNMSSIIASTGYNALSVYAATKASLLGFTKSLAREVGRTGVTVNAIAPGFIDTEMTHELDGTSRDRIVGRSAMRRLANSGRCRGRRGPSHGRGRPEHHRGGHDRGRRQYGLSCAGGGTCAAVFEVAARSEASRLSSAKRRPAGRSFVR